MLPSLGCCAARFVVCCGVDEPSRDSLCQDHIHSFDHTGTDDVDQSTARPTIAAKFLDTPTTNNDTTTERSCSDRTILYRYTHLYR